MHYSVYITAPDAETAKKLGKILLEARLAACVNLFPGITSFYWWENAIQEDTECALIAKTTEDCLPALMAAVKAAHPYDCPCIVSWPISHGNPEYLQWIEENVQSSSK
ncbi:MAG: divalent-cation tolerance protein CutA [Hyphomicrobiales bacterium]|nr:divalent-cation tolerance protein CutA [Hyphomicrobiales bacterium]